MPNLPDFSYFRSRDLGETLAALARPNACIYAGGTDLIVALAARRPWVDFVRELVDIKLLDEAKGISDLGDELRIGTLATATDLARDDLVVREAPALAQAARSTSAPALRGRGTLGGNLVTPHPAGDVATALLALDATVEIAEERGFRDVPLTEMIGADPRFPRLALAVRFRKQPRSAFEKFATRNEFGRSIVSAAVATSNGKLRIALGGMRARPFHAEQTSVAIAAGTSVASALSRECRPPEDGLATNGYRRRLAEALLRRALTRTEKS